MLPYRTTLRDYKETIAEANQVQLSKRKDSKPKSGLRPLRRPVDLNGNKLVGKEYKQWLLENVPQ